MEESRKIKLPLGKVSWEKDLGLYYIDMRPAIIHYTNNIYNGKFDGKGVPMIGVGQGKYDYFPINIAQYGFMLHADYLETQEKQLLETLLNCLNVLERLKSEDETKAVWWHKYHEVKYKINPPWASAMAQGEVISFYLRMYQLLKKENLLRTAEKAYHFMQVKGSEKAVRRYDNNGNLWFEEYPSTPPSNVLNGFIYALFGIIDLFRITGNPEAKADIDRCISTLKNRLKDFDAGYWSYYDLQKKELVRYYYQKNVHAPQLEVLFQLTGESIFLHYANRWKKQINSMNFLFVKIMYRVWPRYRKLMNYFQ
jgi:hypothetical protein